MSRAAAQPHPLPETLALAARLRETHVPALHRIAQARASIDSAESQINLLTPPTIATRATELEEAAERHFDAAQRENDRDHRFRHMRWAGDYALRASILRAALVDRGLA